MMTYQQVRDVVLEIRRAHMQMREALERSRDATTDSRTRLLLAALAQEEQELQLTLGRFESEGQESVLDTWLQYVPDEEMDQALANIEFPPDLSAEDVVARKLEFDEALLNLLSRLGEQSSAPRVQEFFNSLRENLATRTEQQVWSVREYQADAEPPEP